MKILLGSSIGLVVFIAIVMLAPRPDPAVIAQEHVSVTPTVLASPSVAPGTFALRGDDAACLSKDLYDQMHTAAVANNHTAFEYLMGRGCIVTKSGMPVSVIEFPGFVGGTWHVRAYMPDGAPVDLWTNREAVLD